MAQHTSCLPMTPQQRLDFAARLKERATLEAQAGTTDPVAAVSTLLWMAENYLKPVGS